MSRQEIMERLGLTDANFEPRDRMGEVEADVADNASDTADLMDAVAELSMLVSDLMEVQNG